MECPKRPLLFVIFGVVICCCAICDMWACGFSISVHFSTWMLNHKSEYAFQAHVASLSESRREWIGGSFYSGRSVLTQLANRSGRVGCAHWNTCWYCCYWFSRIVVVLLWLLYSCHGCCWCFADSVISLLYCFCFSLEKIQNIDNAAGVTS